MTPANADCGSQPAPTVRVFVGLGSNLGDRAAHLRAALRGLAALPGTELLAVSRLYETEPVGGPPQGPYLNAVAELETRLAPDELMARLLALETAAGRVRPRTRNAPRTLDLDLLLYGTLSMQTPELTVPHPRLAERAFVLEPLRELAPTLRHPTLGVAIEDLAARRQLDAVRLWEEGEGAWRSSP